MTSYILFHSGVDQTTVLLPPYDLPQQSSDSNVDVSPSHSQSPTPSHIRQESKDTLDNESESMEQKFIS